MHINSYLIRKINKKFKKIKLGGFLRNLMFQDISKICLENSFFITIWQE